MTSNSRIPQHVAPYVENVPKDSLILLTSTLSNSINWLVVRYLCGVFNNDAVKARRTLDGDATVPSSDDLGVVLVSWMRDFEFWKTEVRRSAVLDLASLAQKKRFVFVDGLSSSSPEPNGTTLPAPLSKTQPPARVVPVLRTSLPARGPPARAADPTATVATAAITTEDSRTRKLPSIELEQVQRTIESALTSLTTSSAILILDAPDLLLALQEPSKITDTSTSTALHNLILSLRLNPRVHATLLSLASDIDPISSPREDHIPTPLETETQALLVGLAHSADLIISARGLDTGAAGDVGGVLRVTVPGAGQDDDDDGMRKVWKEQELLYLVKTDGSAKVWERGAGVGVG